MPQDLTLFHGTPCLNCGAELRGDFCHHCGQRATDVGLTLKSMVVEFAESLFSLEFGFWQTFRRLVFQPGSLSAEYIAGRRKRYSSPIKLYLGTSLVFFFLIAFFGGSGIKFNQDGEDGTNELTGKAAIEAMRDEVRAARSDSNGAIDPAADSPLADVPLGSNLERLLENPDAAKARFFTYLPRAMFLMVPFSALLFRMAYVRHDRPYLHYLVFSLHLHALFYLTASVAGLLGRIQPEALGDGLALAVFVTFPINTIRAQRRTFGDSWPKAFIKAALVWHVYGFAVLLAVAGAGVLTVFMG